MAWTRDTLVAEFRILVDQPHTAIISSSNAASLINNAYRELIGEIRQRNYRFYYTSDTLSTVINSRYIILPADCVVPNKIVDSDGTVLKRIDMENFPTSTTTCEPEYWDRIGNKIIFPSGADAIYTYTLYYHYQPADMSLGSSVPNFVPGFEDLIPMLAAIKSKMIRDDKSDLITLFPLRLKAMLNAAGKSQTESSGRVHNSTYIPEDL